MRLETQHPLETLLAREARYQRLIEKRLAFQTTNNTRIQELETDQPDNLAIANEQAGRRKLAEHITTALPKLQIERDSLRQAMTPYEDKALQTAEEFTIFEQNKRGEINRLKRRASYLTEGVMETVVAKTIAEIEEAARDPYVIFGKRVLAERSGTSTPGPSTPAPAERETPSPKDELFSITLPNGQIVETQSQKVARAIEAFIQHGNLGNLEIGLAAMGQEPHQLPTGDSDALGHIRQRGHALKGTVEKALNKAGYTLGTVQGNGTRGQPFIYGLEEIKETSRPERRADKKEKSKTGPTAPHDEERPQNEQVKQLLSPEEFAGLQNLLKQNTALDRLMREDITIKKAFATIMDQLPDNGPQLNAIAIIRLRLGAFLKVAEILTLSEDERSRVLTAQPHEVQTILSFCAGDQRDNVITTAIDYYHRNTGAFEASDATLRARFGAMERIFRPPTERIQDAPREIEKLTIEGTFPTIRQQIQREVTAVLGNLDIEKLDDKISTATTRLRIAKARSWDERQYRKASQHNVIGIQGKGPIDVQTLELSVGDIIAMSVFEDISHRLLQTKGNRQMISEMKQIIKEAVKSALAAKKKTD